MENVYIWMRQKRYLMKDDFAHLRTILVIFWYMLHIPLCANTQFNDYLQKKTKKLFQKLSTEQNSLLLPKYIT